ncbi:MAG: hypothetical protein AMXMBFR84_31350 [Candidatus Hydrogenedentota bacterium]
MPQENNKEKLTQYIAVGTSVGVLIIMLVLGLFFRGGGGNAISREAASKPLVAKTTRANQKTIQSEKRNANYDNFKRTSTNKPRETPTERALAADSKEDEPGESGQNNADPPESQGSSESEIHEEMTEDAQNSTEDSGGASVESPEQAIEAIVGAFDSLDQVANASAVYRTLGELYLQTTPVQLEMARVSLAAAIETAGDETERNEAVLAQANLLFATGDWAGAEDLLAATPIKEEAESLDEVRLQLLHGALRDRAGNEEEAEELYAAAVRRSEALLQSDPEASAVYREGCVKLARLYRSTGRGEQADRIANAMAIALKP